MKMNYRVLSGVVLCGLANWALGQNSAGEPLADTFAKLAKNETFRVGYIGGSVTAGAGASKPALTSWRALTTQWFKDNFPNATIEEINACIGGTGCDLGTYRCGEELTDKNPDLVFVEFAVNATGPNDATAIRSMEGIVRGLWKKNPDTDIVFVYATMRNFEGYLTRDTYQKSVLLFEQVADRYGIPSVNIGAAMWDKIRKGEGDWNAYLQDAVHPRDAGHAVYAAAVIAFLEKCKASPGAPAPHTLPAPLEPLSDRPCKMVKCVETTAEGWEKENWRTGNRWSQSLTSDTAGAEVKFRFAGTAVGIWYLKEKDGGEVECAVDGQPAKRVSAYAGGPQSEYFIVDDNLAEGEHELVIKVLAENNPASTGHRIRLGKFLVRE